MKCRWTAILALALLGAVRTSSATELYSVEYAGQTPLYQLNQTTGAATAIGPTGYNDIGDLTSDTSAGTPRLWGIRISDNQLLRINPATGAGISTVNITSPFDIVSIAFNSVTGRLYGNTSSAYGAPADTLYEINPTTGATTLVGPITFDNVFALGFSQTGRLYGVSDTNDQFIEINPGTGAGSLISALPLGSVFDLASRPEDDVMFLVDSSGSQLWTIDTTTAQLTAVGPFGSGNPNLVGLAFSPVPEPSTFALAAIAIGAIGARRFYRRK